MAEKLTKMKLDDYMVLKKMTKEQVFQAISRKEISGSFVAGEWMIFDNGVDVSVGSSEADQKVDNRVNLRLEREKEEAIAKIAMAQTMAKTAQTEARNSSDKKTKATKKKGNDSLSDKRSPSTREGRKSEVLRAPITDAFDTKAGPLVSGKVDLRKSGMAESILAEARELALGSQSKASPPANTPTQSSSFAEGILAEARDLAKLHDEIAVTGNQIELDAKNVPSRKRKKPPTFIARQFEDNADEGKEEERWKTKIDEYILEKGINMQDAFKLITQKKVDGQFINGSWYIIDNDEEHEERKASAAASAALAEQQLKAEEVRREAQRRQEARGKIKIGDYMLEHGLEKEQVFKLIQDKSIEGSFSNGEWYILESLEDVLIREKEAETESEALAVIEREKEEAYKERKHEADLQDGLNEEQRARALTMPFITDAQFADRTILRTIGVVQGSTVRSKSLPAELSTKHITLPGAELVAFTADLSEARAQAIDRMRVQAFVQGANAIVSTHFNTSMIDLGATEILVYGTAVVVATATI
jgi:uncharacterized protein YbjQ (UPF0145 family)